MTRDGGFWEEKIILTEGMEDQLVEYEKELEIGSSTMRKAVIPRATVRNAEIKEHYHYDSDYFVTEESSIEESSGYESD